MYKYVVKHLSTWKVIKEFFSYALAKDFVSRYNDSVFWADNEIVKMEATKQ